MPPSAAQRTVEYVGVREVALRRRVETDRREVRDHVGRIRRDGDRRRERDLLPAGGRLVRERRRRQQRAGRRPQAAGVDAGVAGALVEPDARRCSRPWLARNFMPSSTCAVSSSCGTGGPCAAARACTGSRDGGTAVVVKLPGDAGADAELPAPSADVTR